MKDKTAIFNCLANLAIKLCNFKMDLIKWQLNFRSCNGLKSLVISNRTGTVRSFEFEITRTCMISDPIALHSVQLPLEISIQGRSLQTIY